MGLLSIVCVAAWLVVVVSARLVRGRLFAIFAGVVLGLQSLSIVGIGRSLEEGQLVLAGLELLVATNFLMLLRPRMRALPVRLLVSWPASIFLAGSVLALPWSAAIVLGAPRWIAWIPFALALLGFAQSLVSREETVDVVIGDGDAGPRVARRRSPALREARPLRIVQITDPHLGPFMSVEALAGICRRAVERDPDLILLTGDYLTMESQSDPSYLTRALAPLAAAKGKVFACHGNHDHEAPRIVAEALAVNGIPLLVDAEAIVETPVGPVQIVGSDFVWRDRPQRLAALAAACPRREGHLRLWLLHHPGAFADLPEGEGDLVLSGHTHGGHVGFLSLGLEATIVSLVSDIPDHGLWARGRDRLYVHRGTCHYGFPVRLGVPAERSLMQVHRA